jgi:putative ABC transport system ATP-binding protein
MNDPIIRAHGLTKTYGQGASQTQALRGVDLEIARGGLTCIVGPSGHGKSTLMHLLGGLDRPTSGRVELDGQDMFTLRDSELAALRSRKIGFVFQFFNLLQSLTAQENVETALMLAGASETRQRERAEELLELVGLSDKKNAKPGQLSGGQQQRVAIARAIVGGPKIILADEPTGNLDSQMGAEIMAILEELNSSGATIVMVTHDPSLAARTSRTIRLFDGRPVQ